MKTSVRFIALIIAITATFVTQHAHAQAFPFTIGLTEVSPTELDFSGGVSSVQNTSPDHWTVTLSNPNLVVFTGSNTAWADPGNSGAGNVLTSSGSSPGILFVVSDMTTSFSLNGNGTTVSVAGQIENPAALPSPAAGNITFTDNAATAEASVPDTGSTLGLLAVALAALFGANRFRALRLGLTRTRSGAATVAEP